MEKALLRDAVHTQKFFFRKNITTKRKYPTLTINVTINNGKVTNTY